MQNLISHLWFDNNALEAVTLYTEIFDDSYITNKSIIPDTPSGDALIIDFKLANLDFSAINGGPYFSFNSSISLMVACETSEEVDYLYSKLSLEAFELMPLGEYPFSKHYVWLKDKYGLNWQIMLVENIQNQEKIRPVLLFADKACGFAKEATNYYTSVFSPSSKKFENSYLEGEAEDNRAKIKYSELSLLNTPFVFMDHGMGGEETFTEAFSFVILCDNQNEIDYYWDKLSHVPQSEQCGWVKDKYGVSWQIVPSMMIDTMKNGTVENIKKITKAFLKMKKFDIDTLEKALHN